MSSQKINVEFHGTAREWFGIWIVNILLSILTIGIYSAWAKVRTKKYFYQNTVIAGRNFDYHATGGQIFKGRLIIIAGVIAYSIIASFAPLFAPVIALAFAFLMPYFIAKSIKFNASNTSWANVRMGFDGSIGDSYLIYLFYPFLTALTLYTTAPFLARARARYFFNNYRLGTSRFSFSSGIGPFYKIFGIALAIFVVFGAISVPLLISTLATSDFSRGAAANQGAMIAVILPLYFALILILIILAVLVQTMILRLIMNKMTLGGEVHRFASSLSATRMVWITISNAVVVIITLGLMAPWAQIRKARYIAQSSHVVPNGSLDEFIGNKEAQQSALGEAYVDIEGIDVGFGI
jgi:uncharacterized membrane protein YjgN (DUF898 family)